MAVIKNVNISMDAQQESKIETRSGSLLSYTYRYVVCSNECAFLSLVLAKIKSLVEEHQKCEYSQGQCDKNEI